MFLPGGWLTIIMFFLWSGWLSHGVVTVIRSPHGVIDYHMFSPWSGWLSLCSSYGVIDLQVTLGHTEFLVFIVPALYTLVWKCTPASSHWHTLLMTLDIYRKSGRGMSVSMRIWLFQHSCKLQGHIYGAYSSWHTHTSPTVIASMHCKEQISVLEQQTS